jgi:hypothetical protein
MKQALLVASIICLLVFVSVAQAQSGGGYELAWTSIDAGGGAMSGGAYSLTSNIGQPEPGVTQSGGGYSLNGGVVDAGASGGIAPGGQRVYVPLILR